MKKGVQQNASFAYTSCFFGFNDSTAAQYVIFIQLRLNFEYTKKTV